METTSGVEISPGYTFVMPDSPASLSFNSTVIVSSFQVNGTNVSLGSFHVGVQKSPASGSPVTMIVTTFALTATLGTAFAWVGSIPSGSVATFIFSGLSPGLRYTVGVDNASAGTLDGPAFAFAVSSSGTHYIELTITNPPTLDTNTWIFIFLLLAYLALLTYALVRDSSTMLIPAGVIMFLIAFQAWTVTANFPATIAIVVVGIVTLFEGIPRQGSGD
jgi:hypothetical protein